MCAPGKINLDTQIFTMYLQKQANESTDEDIVIVCTLQRACFSYQCVDWPNTKEERQNQMQGNSSVGVPDKSTLERI